MPDGGVIAITLKNIELDEMTAAKHPELDPGRYVNLIVSDTGLGISQEEMDRIFDPYFTTKEEDRDTGMGLAVVHGIVKGHNGLITVESDLGKEILNIRPDIPIILCTGFCEKIDEKAAKAIGAADYIEKPLDKRDFAFKVRKVLDGK